jgi:hypothetical protein
MQHITRQSRPGQSRRGSNAAASPGQLAPGQSRRGTAPGQSTPDNARRDSNAAHYQANQNGAAMQHINWAINTMPSETGQQRGTVPGHLTPGIARSGSSAAPELGRRGTMKHITWQLISASEMGQQRGTAPGQSTQGKARRGSNAAHHLVINPKPIKTGQQRSTLSGNPYHANQNGAATQHITRPSKTRQHTSPCN